MTEGAVGRFAPVRALNSILSDREAIYNVRRSASATASNDLRREEADSTQQILKARV